MLDISLHSILLRQGMGDARLQGPKVRTGNNRCKPTGPITPPVLHPMQTCKSILHRRATFQCMHEYSLLFGDLESSACAQGRANSTFRHFRCMTIDELMIMPVDPLLQKSPHLAGAVLPAGLKAIKRLSDKQLHCLFSSTPLQPDAAQALW